MDFNSKIRKIVRATLNEIELTTNLQKKLVHDLLKQDATTKEKAQVPVNQIVAEKLGLKGILNTFNGHEYWIRQENEKPTGVHRFFMLYGSYMNNKKDNKGFVFCKFSAGYNWRKTILPPLRRLSRKLGKPPGENILIESGYIEEFYNSKYPKYEFNGQDFVRVG